MEAGGYTTTYTTTFPGLQAIGWDLRGQGPGPILPRLLIT